MCSTPATVESSHPANRAQERHWFLHHYEGDGSAQTLSQVREVRGPYSVPSIVAAIQAVARAHGALRRRFFMTEAGLRWSYIGGEWHDVVRLELDDCSQDDELRDAILECQSCVLDPDAGTVFRAYVVTGRQRCFVCLVAHASAVDARSLSFLFEQVARALEGASMEFIDAPEEHADELGGASEAYWKTRLTAELPRLELPQPSARPPRKHHEAEALSTSLASELTERVETFCRESSVTPEAVFLAAYVAVLRRWTRQETVVVGRHVDLRQPGRAGAIGSFDNLLPMPLCVTAQTSFRELARSIEADIQADAQHRWFPYEKLIQLAKEAPDPSRNPLFQAVFRSIDRSDVATTNHRFVRSFALERWTTACDVELIVETDENSVGLTLLFDKQLFDDTSMWRMLNHCVRQIETGLTDPELPAVATNVLSEQEQAELDACNVRPGPESGLTLLDLFARAVQAHADRVAVEFREQRLSYLELDRYSNHVADLLRANGVQSGDCVGICLDRSIEMAAFVLGVLKCGAAYVPMDPTYPEDRLGVMAEDSGSPLVVVHARYRDRFPDSVRLLVHEEHLDGNARSEAVRVDCRVEPESLAYVIFTSGSTGRPKGVAMPHRALVNLIEWQLERQTFEPGARVLQYSSLSFDVSFQEIFSTWGSGGTLHLVSDDERRDPRRLLALLVDLSIERLFLPYVALRQMIEVAHSTDRYPTSLREVITAGEQLRVDDAVRRFFRRIPGASLDNQYGPSETHVITAELLSGDPQTWPALPPIGTPIRNNQAFVLDEFHHHVPLGVTGELYLAGVNLAQGYIGRAELTRERFLENPFATDRALMYRTGDLARFDRTGKLEFLGRIDHQVKIRGYRIEPGEIDAVLGEIAGVKQSLTKVVDDERLGKRLVSYVLVDEPQSFDGAAALAHARQRLPSYMVPSAVLPLAELPFTPSGKVDMRALPVPDLSADAARASRVPASTPTERDLVEAWKRLLGLSEVGVEESFFELGGDSLKAVDLFLDIERRFGRDLPLSVLATSDTIRSLAAVIDGQDSTWEKAGLKALRLIQPGSEGENPLFLVHGGGGNVILFNGLARQLPAELPVYAFQWTGWNDRRGSSSISEMAELYLREMRSLQPEGPYRLAGHCIGGMIALEMARRLRASGESLDGPLIVTDTPNVHAASYRSGEPVDGSADADTFAEIQRQIEHLLEPSRNMSRGGDASRSYRPAHGRWFRRLVRLFRIVHQRFTEAPFPRYRVETRLERAYVRLLLASGLKVPMQYRSTYAAISMIDACLKHFPKPYDGDVVYIRTGLLHGREIGLQGWWASLYMGFEEICREDHWTAHVIDATHDGVIEHPMTAEIFRRNLNM